MYSVAVTRNMLRLPSSSLLSCQTMATMKPIAASEALQGQEFWSKNKRLARPMSPHLTIYKPQLTSMMSITHRITGCVQSGILSGAALGVLIMPGDQSTNPSIQSNIPSLWLSRFLFITY